MKILVVASVLAGLACATTPDIRDHVGEFSVEYPKNYLVVHQGSPERFRAAKCYEISEVTDQNATFKADKRFTQLVEERLPLLPPCGSRNDWPRLSIHYQAGYGVCMHDCSNADPRSAFAFLTLSSSASEVEDQKTTAEWQYWRGGTAELVLEQFVFDLTNLIVHGLEKAPPEPRK